MARRATTPRRKRLPAPADVVLIPEAGGTAPQCAAAVAEGIAAGGQLLTFLIGDDEYGISILRVREIAEYRSLTPVPMTPPWMRGVMNLRGTVVPTIDLAARLGLEQTTVGRRTCLIIVELDSDEERAVMAVMVDAVSRVVDLSASDIQEPPPFGLAIDFVPGLVRIDERLIVLLDLTAILASTDVLSLEIPRLLEEVPRGSSEKVPRGSSVPRVPRSNRSEKPESARTSPRDPEDARESRGTEEPRNPRNPRNPTRNPSNRGTEEPEAPHARQ